MNPRTTNNPNPPSHHNNSSIDLDPLTLAPDFEPLTMPRKAKARSRNTLSNSLRIIAGKWRGRKLQFPDSEGLRPTSDRVRETLFNWLSPAIHDASCLDLFCGSGALSLEALSRGASEALLIDASTRVCEQLRSNLKLLKCNSAKVLTKDTIKWLKEPNSEEKPFDIVFVDPPFNRNLAAFCCELLDSQGLVKQGSYIYIETESALSLQLPSSWHIHRQKKAGQVAYYLCIKQP